MKSLISCLLIVAVSLITVSKSVICFSYVLNKDFISNHLCENRNNPQLHCNGKCHIIKKLTEENKRENLPVNLKNNLEIQFYSEKNTDYNFSLFYSGEVLFSDLMFPGVHPVFTFFRPPQA
ncbi:MAG: hypothetical protein ABI855_20315 [Bacteroidota bacterium]